MRQWINVVSFYHSRPGHLWPLNQIAVLFILAVAVSVETGECTPLLALRESNQCGACHNPGRSQRPLLERRCTLDCQGCHIDPNGSGPRNQWGAYYEYDSLSVMSFFKPEDPLKESRRYDLHFDSRMIAQQTGSRFRRFPMNSDFALRIRPFITHLHLTAHSSFLGRIGTDKISYHSREINRHQQKFSLMLDALPLNTYVRVFRGPPVYGVRRPNHSLWIREWAGLDQFAMTDGIAVGGTPTVPYLHYSLMRGNHSHPEEDRQKGYSFHGGMRGVTLGWHLNGSLWDTSSRKVRVEMQALGGGAKVYGFLLMGEKNWRTVTEKNLNTDSLRTLSSRAVRVHSSSVIDELTLAWSGIKGIMPGIVLETLVASGINSRRKSLFIDLHPFPFLQLELWRRQESGSRSRWDTLALAHIYGSF